MFLILLCDFLLFLRVTDLYNVKFCSEYFIVYLFMIVYSLPEFSYAPLRLFLGREWTLLPLSGLVPLIDFKDRYNHWSHIRSRDAVFLYVFRGLDKRDILLFCPLILCFSFSGIFLLNSFSLSLCQFFLKKSSSFFASIYLFFFLSRLKMERLALGSGDFSRWRGAFGRELSWHRELRSCRRGHCPSSTV